MASIRIKKLISKAIVEFDEGLSSAVYHCARKTYRDHQGNFSSVQYISSRCIPIGMVDHFVGRIKKNYPEIHIEIVEGDKTPRLDFRKLILDSEKVPQEHQAKIDDIVAKNLVGLISSPTGSGKTFSMALIVGRMQTTTLIITPTELAQVNAYDEMVSCFGKKNVSMEIPERPPIISAEIRKRESAALDTGEDGGQSDASDSFNKWLLMKSGKKDKPKKGTPEWFKWSREKATERAIENGVNKDWCKPIHIICAASAKNLPYWYTQRVNMIIVDEAHGAYASLTRNLILRSNVSYLYGLSATDWRDLRHEDEILKALFGGRIYELSIDDAIDRNIHAKVDLLVLNTPPPEKFFKRVKDPREIMDDGIIRNSNRNEQICSLAYREASEGNNVFVAIDEVGHFLGKEGDEDISYCLSEKLKKWNIPVFFISGDLSTKEKIAELSRIREQPDGYVVVGTMAFGIAVDVPAINVVIHSSWGKSSIRLIQRSGRAARTEGKNKTMKVYITWDGWNESLKKQSKKRMRAVCDYYGVSPS